MKKNKNIAATDRGWLEELKNLSPAIANIPKQNPFLVPTGYFNELKNQVYAELYHEEEEMKDPDIPITSSTPFSLPGDYFKNLRKDIYKRIELENDEEPDIEEELKGIAPGLGKVSRQNPFRVPAGYFGNLVSVAGKQAGIPERKPVIRKLASGKIANWIAAAAMLAGIIFTWSIVEQEEQGNELFTATTDDINTYMEVYADDLYDALLNQEVDEFEFTLPAYIETSESLEDIPSSDIENYIIDDIDLELIQQELL